MDETELSPIHSLPSGLCEDLSGEHVTLIRRMAHDDAAALVELHGMWSPVFLGVAYRMLGDRRDAEDVVQDTFVRLWRRAAEYDSHQSPPFVWAFAVLRGYCMDRLRSRHRSKRDASRVGHNQPHPSPPPEKPENPRVMALDDFRRVKSALDHLAADERNCLELAVFLGYTHSEIADHLVPSLGSVKNRLRHALTKVRNHLSRYEL
jgi:RNA polymerase sigma-70 factor (ECF subfamily)